MGKKIDNVIYGGLTVGTAGITATTVGMTIDAFKKKDKFSGTAYALASIAFAGMSAVSAKEVININKKKK